MTVLTCPTCEFENPSSLDDPCEWCVRCGSAVTSPPVCEEIMQLVHEATITDDED